MTHPISAAKPARVKDLHDRLGVAKGHASEILRGKTTPSQKLAIRIYREFGLKLGPLAHASKAEIETMARLHARGTATQQVDA